MRIEQRRKGRAIVMARNFAELEAKMTPTALAESDRRTQLMLAELLENDLKESADNAASLGQGAPALQPT